MQTRKYNVLVGWFPPWNFEKWNYGKLDLFIDALEIINLFIRELAAAYLLSSTELIEIINLTTLEKPYLSHTLSPQWAKSPKKQSVGVYFFIYSLYF